MAIEPLREFQAEDIPFFIAQKRAMILYEPRLGKTVVSCNIFAKIPCKQVMIACPKNAMAVWHAHIQEWMAELDPTRSYEIIFVRGKNTSTAKAERERLWLKPRTATTTFYIMTWSVLERDFQFLQLPSTIKSGLRFDTVVGDEVHKRLKNRKNKSVAIMKYFTDPRRCQYFYALSGTMGGKGGPADFWALLNLIDPIKFRGYWPFVNQHCEMIDGYFGKEIIGIKNPKNFHAVLDAHGRRRFRHVCAPQMPKVSRDLLRVEATTQQMKLLQDISIDKFIQTENSFVIAATSMETILRKRQILCCPKIIDKALGYGAAIEDLVERLTDDEISPTDDDKHVVVFTAFRPAVGFIREALNKAGFANVFELYGGIEPEDQTRIINDFKRTKGIVVCTVKYAEAFSLVPATQSFFIGYEWDPNENKQAEDRLVPQTGMNPINSYYYCCSDVDEGIAHYVSQKNAQITLTLGSAKVFTDEQA